MRRMVYCGSPFKVQSIMTKKHSSRNLKQLIITHPKSKRRELWMLTRAQLAFSILYILGFPT